MNNHNTGLIDHFTNKALQIGYFAIHATRMQITSQVTITLGTISKSIITRTITCRLAYTFSNKFTILTFLPHLKMSKSLWTGMLSLTASSSTS